MGKLTRDTRNYTYIPYRIIVAMSLVTPMLDYVCNIVTIPKEKNE